MEHIETSTKKNTNRRGKNGKLNRKVSDLSKSSTGISEITVSENTKTDMSGLSNGRKRKLNNSGDKNMKITRKATHSYKTDIGIDISTKADERTSKRISDDNMCNDGTGSKTKAEKHKKSNYTNELKNEQSQKVSTEKQSQKLKSVNKRQKSLEKTEYKNISENTKSMVNSGKLEKKVKHKKNEQCVDEVLLQTDSESHCNKNKIKKNEISDKKGNNKKNIQNGQSNKKQTSSKNDKERDKVRGKQKDSKGSKEKVMKRYTIVENGDDSDVKTGEKHRKTVVIESKGKLIQVDIVKSGNAEKSHKKKAKLKNEKAKCDEIEIMSCDDCDESETEFEIQTKKLKLSPNVEPNKRRKPDVGKGKKMSTKIIDKEAGKKRVSFSKDGDINKTPVKKLKMANDQVKKTSAKTVEKKIVKSKSKTKVATTNKTSNKKKSKHSPVKEGNVDMLSQIDHTDVTAVLLHMEGGNSGMPFTGPGTSSGDLMDDSSSQEEESDWEEVEDHPGSKSPVKTQISKEPIEITLDVPEIVKHRKKKQFDWNAYLQRQMNRFKKELREDIHKVHLMCLMSRGMYLNRICNHVELQAVALSLVQEEFMSKSKQLYHTHALHRLFKWLKSTVVIDNTLTNDDKNLVSTLTDRLQSKKASSLSEFVLLFVILLRSLGLDVRLVVSLQPLSMKDISSKKKESPKSSKKDTSGSKAKAQQKTTSIKSRDSKSSVTCNIPSTSKTSANKITNNESKTKDTEYVNTKLKTKNQTLRSRGSKVKLSSYIEDQETSDSEDEFVPVEDEEDSDNDVGPVKKKVKSKNSRKRPETKSKYFKENKQKIDDVNDFMEDTTIYRTPTSKSKLSALKNRKILSDSEDSVEVIDEDKMKQGCDQWVEVFVEAEGKWMCFDCLKGQMNKPYEIENTATQPVHYVLCYDNEEIIKDVTARYASKWMTDTRKFRVNKEWWEETLDPYVTFRNEQDQKEDEHINANLIKRPFPTSISAFKNHPLYVLTRHLLKFEAIYPETAIPLGYIKREPIYARECVHVLHSRENWLKEGRAVRVKEEPYKMVKSRPKWKQPKENPDALDLECFGIWQTEKYIPPPVIDGKIPRNGYGNLELFKPWMLPLGTVHLQVPGLNKVAKKLNMDCVPAMVGWDTHCGFSHPLLDGFIVCEEDKDILLAAWDEDQEIQKQRESEKREKRVYGNWKLLIKGLLIKDRLQRRYDLDAKNDDEEMSKENGEKAQDYMKSWPRKQQDEEQQSQSTHYKMEVL